MREAMTMTTAEADVMTDNQWDGMIKMFMMMVYDTETKEQIMQKLMLLLRNEEEAEKVVSKLKKQKSEV